MESDKKKNAIVTKEWPIRIKYQMEHVLDSEEDQAQRDRNTHYYQTNTHKHTQTWINRFYVIDEKRECYINKTIWEKRTNKEKERKKTENCCISFKLSQNMLKPMDDSSYISRRLFIQMHFLVFDMKKCVDIRSSRYRPVPIRKWKKHNSSKSTLLAVSC